MLVSIYRGLVYLNFKLQGLVVEVKEVSVFVLHRQCYAINIIVAALRVAQNMLLRCLVVNLFKGLSTNIESCQDSRRFPIEQVLPFVNQVAVNEVGAGCC